MTENATSADTENITETNPIRYRGYYYDTETRLYYLKSRYYDPAVKKFLNVDGLVSTSVEDAAKNMYAYCLNNPVIYADPDGKMTVEALTYILLNMPRKIVHTSQNIVEPDLGSRRKILRITVGLEQAENIPTVKGEIVKYYNDALKKTYSQVKKATVTLSDEGVYTFNGKSEKMVPNKNTFTGNFVNGVDENNLPAYTYGPDTKLTENMLSSATIAKMSNGLKIRLVIKSEKVDVKKDSVYNAAGGFPFEFGYDGTFIKDYTSGSVTYSGTVIEAVTDTNGRVKELNVKTPYSSEFTMKQKNGKVDKITEKGETSYYGIFTF